MNNQSPKGNRIAKVLSRAGIASRREAEKIILAGRVKVNGEILTSPAFNVLNSDIILIDDDPIAKPDEERLWCFHKPVGAITTAKDEKNRKTIYDYFPSNLPRVMPVGRLDLNSEGLLLLTNSGELKRKLELPSSELSRLYRVRVKGRPKEASLESLRSGISIEKEFFRVDSDGFISKNSHPKSLGSALKNKYITTDFAEAQVELVTPTFENIDDLYEFLHSLHIFVAQINFT